MFFALPDKWVEEDDSKSFLDQVLEDSVKVGNDLEKNQNIYS